MKDLLFLFCLTLGLTAQAQNLQNQALSSFRATGTGTVSHEPEFLDVRFLVNANCFKEADAATNDANAKINALKVQLQKIANGPNDRVLVPGTRLSWRGNSRDNYNPKGCLGGYYAEGAFSVRIAIADRATMVKKFGELQQITAAANTAASDDEIEKVNVSSSVPIPGLTSATRKLMFQQAEQIARKNFNEDLERKMSLCGVSEASIVAMRPMFDEDTSAGYPAAAAAMPFSAKSGSPAVSVNLEFDPIKVSYTFANEYQFVRPFNIRCDGGTEASKP